MKLFYTSRTTFWWTMLQSIIFKPSHQISEHVPWWTVCPLDYSMYDLKIKVKKDPTFTKQKHWSEHVPRWTLCPRPQHSIHEPKSSSKRTLTVTSHDPGGHYVLDLSILDPKPRSKRTLTVTSHDLWNKTLTETIAIHWWDTLTPTFLFWDRYSNVMMLTHNIFSFII